MSSIQSYTVFYIPVMIYTQSPTINQIGSNLIPKKKGKRFAKTMKGPKLSKGCPITGNI